MSAQVGEQARGATQVAGTRGLLGLVGQGTGEREAIHGKAPPQAMREGAQPSGVAGRGERGDTDRDAMGKPIMRASSVSRTQPSTTVPTTPMAAQ